MRAICFNQYLERETAQEIEDEVLCLDPGNYPGGLGGWIYTDGPYMGQHVIPSEGNGKESEE